MPLRPVSFLISHPKRWSCIQLPCVMTLATIAFSASHRFYWSWCHFWLTNKVWQQKVVLRGHNIIFYIWKGASCFLYYSYVKILQPSCCRLTTILLRSCVNCPEARSSLGGAQCANRWHCCDQHGKEGRIECAPKMSTIKVIILSEEVLVLKKTIIIDHIMQPPPPP